MRETRKTLVSSKKRKKKGRTVAAAAKLEKGERKGWGNENSNETSGDETESFPSSLPPYSRQWADDARWRRGIRQILKATMLFRIFFPSLSLLESRNREEIG